MKNKSIGLLLVIVAFFFSGCPAQTGMLLNDNLVQLYLNESYQIELENNVSFNNIVITEYDEDIISISDSGLITPLTSGDTVVRFRYKTEYDSIRLLIIDEYCTAGTIRNNSDSWFVMDDHNHQPIGIQDIETDSEKIIVKYNFNANKVITFSVTLDETIASDGYFAGSSVGLNEAHIYLYKSEAGVVSAVDPGNVTAGHLNLWIYGKFQP